MKILTGADKIKEWAKYPPYMDYGNTALNTIADRCIHLSLFAQATSYLSDMSDQLDTVLKPNKFNVLVSDTGMGKSTYAIKHLIKNPKYKSPILIMPLTIIKDEFVEKLINDIALDVNIELQSHDLLILSNPDQKKKITICTYHHFAHHFHTLLVKPDLIIWDEVHWLTSYHWAAELTATLHLIIRHARYEGITMIGLTATPGPLLFFPRWFFIDLIVTVKTNLKVPPQTIIIYKLLDDSISKVNCVNHYLNRIQSGEKVIIIAEKSNRGRQSIMNAVDILNHGLETGCFGNPQFKNNLVSSVEAHNKKANLNLNIDYTKSEQKEDNSNVQSIIESQTLDDGTDVFIATIFLSNGVNIHDTRVKHMIILSDKMDLIKQSAARLRVPNNTNLVLFYREGDIPPDLNNKLIPVDSFDQYLIEKMEQPYTLDSNTPNFYMELKKVPVFNPSTPIGRWYDYFQQVLYLKLDTALELTYPNIPLEIVNEELLNMKLFKGNLKKLKELSGFKHVEGVTNEQIRLAYGIELVETKEEEKMYKGCGKASFENCMKKLGLEYKDIKIHKYTDKNKNTIFKLIEIL